MLGEERGPLTLAILVAVAAGYSHTAEQLTARSCALAATTGAGATFPCGRRLRSQSCQSVLLAVRAICCTQIQDLLSKTMVIVKHVIRHRTNRTSW